MFKRNICKASNIEAVVILIIIILSMTGCTKEKKTIEQHEKSTFETYSKEGITFNYGKGLTIDDNYLRRIGLIKLYDNNTIFTIQIIPVERYKSESDLIEKLILQILKEVDITYHKNGFEYTFVYKNSTYVQHYDIYKKRDYYAIFTYTCKKDIVPELEEKYNLLTKSARLDDTNFSFIQLPLEVPIEVYGPEREKKIKKALHDFISNYSIGDKIVMKGPHLFTVYTLEKDNALIDLNNDILGLSEVEDRILKDTSPLDKIKIMAITYYK